MRVEEKRVGKRRYELERGEEKKRERRDEEKSGVRREKGDRWS